MQEEKILGTLGLQECWKSGLWEGCSTPTDEGCNFKSLLLFPRWREKQSIKLDSSYIIFLCNLSDA